MNTAHRSKSLDTTFAIRRAAIRCCSKCRGSSGDEGDGCRACFDKAIQGRCSTIRCTYDDGKNNERQRKRHATHEPNACERRLCKA